MISRNPNMCIHNFFNIPIGIPSVENLTVNDCNYSVEASWDITENSVCTGLPYNVTLISSDDGVLRSVTTNNTVTNYNFTNVERLNEVLSVTVFVFNKNASGASVTVNATNG